MEDGSSCDVGAKEGERAILDEDMQVTVGGDESQLRDEKPIDISSSQR